MRNGLLILLLVWTGLLNKAVILKIEEKEGFIKEEQARQKEEILNEQKKQAYVLDKENNTEKAENTEKLEKMSEDTAEHMIRVLLMDSGYQSYYHSAVTVSYGGEQYTYDSNSPELKEGSTVIEEQENGIQVQSIERQCGNPVYSGSLEITKTDQGLILVNELPVETYLEAVLPSEMPSSYDAEALKAQAVCARTYAEKQIQNKKMEEYHADVDDSVNYQVYQNISPVESTTRAVEATKGQVMYYDDQLIEAYYFSTSAGVTSTDEVWGAAEAAPYLKSVICSFDSEEPWSRWSVSIPWEKIEMQAAELGRLSSGLKGIEIFRKSENGTVTGLRIITEETSFELKNEYDIRSFLSPEGCVVTERDGTESMGGKLLPSACFSMTVNTGSEVYLEGGGYGHGVGMSQTAANQMAEQGYDYREILHYFFQNIEIAEISTINNDT